MWPTGLYNLNSLTREIFLPDDELKEQACDFGNVTNNGQPNMISSFQIHKKQELQKAELT